METRVKYKLPIDKSKATEISSTKSHAHRFYPHSVDFIAPMGTPIKAAADGIVIDVKEDSDKGGRNRKYEEYENFIEIRHGEKNYEYSYYGHIKKKGSLVKTGDKVKRGQVIGFVGETGWMANINEPHLHFMVGKYKYKTMKINFKKT